MSTTIIARSSDRHTHDRDTQQRRHERPKGDSAREVPYPVLATRRFRFRPFVFADIRRLVALAGEHRIADTTIGVPHPFTPEFARMWISSHPAEWDRRQSLHWAVHEIGNNRMVGYAGLSQIDIDRRQGELRFWVGCGAERFSCAVEWSEAIVTHGLSVFALTRVYALQLARHPLAGRVLAAIGMRPEGFLRKRIDKSGLLEDICCWAVQQSHASAEFLA
jgi:[ribosomal protein S5]-alanine N-acetyltransferase